MSKANYLSIKAENRKQKAESFFHGFCFQLSAFSFLGLLAAFACVGLQCPAGTVVAWGNNFSGQTDVPPGLTNVIAVSAGGEGSLLDHTLILWTNELGKGNSHTLDNIPFVLLGGGFGFQMGRSLKLPKVAHNRLHLALAHAVGHRLETFGKPALCDGGPLDLS